MLTKILFLFVFTPGLFLNQQIELTEFQEKCAKASKTAIVEMAFGQIRGSLFQPPVAHSNLLYNGTVLLCTEPNVEIKS